MDIQLKLQKRRKAKRRRKEGDKHDLCFGRLADTPSQTEDVCNYRGDAVSVWRVGGGDSGGERSGERPRGE